MTWGTVGTIVGAVVGSVVPGVGTSLGAALGGALGGMIDASLVPTSRLSDLSVSRVSLGAPISVLFGHPRTGGNVIWCSPAIGNGKVGGSKGDGGGTETYVRHVLVMLGEGVTGPATRIWAGGKLIHNRLATADDETVEASLEEAVIGEVIYYDGSDDQLPDPTYALAVGEANAIAYRGKSTLMLKDFSCGTSGQLPPVTIEVGGEEAGRLGARTRLILDDFALADYRGTPPEGASSTSVSVVAIAAQDALLGPSGGVSGGITTFYADGDTDYNQVPGGFSPQSCGQGNGDIAVAVYGADTGTMLIAVVGSGHSVLFPSQQPTVSLGSTALRFSVFDGVIAVTSTRAFGSVADFVGATAFIGQVYLHQLDGTPLGMTTVQPDLSGISSIALGEDFLWVYDGGTAINEYGRPGLALARALPVPGGLGLRIFVSEQGALCCANEAAQVWRWTGDPDDVWTLLNTMDDYEPVEGDPPLVLGTHVAHHMVSGDTTYAVKTESVFVEGLPDVIYTKSDWYDPIAGGLQQFRSVGEIVGYYATIGANGRYNSYPGWAHSFTYGDPALEQWRESTYKGAAIISDESWPIPGEVTRQIIVEVYAERLYGYPGDTGQPPGMYPASTQITIYRNVAVPLKEFKVVDVYRKRAADVYDLTEPTLQQVVEAICLRAGLDPAAVDATELASTNVHAFAITQIGASSSALELLMSVYRFYCVESGGKLVFKFLGAASARTIPYADMGATFGEAPANPLPLTRGSELELPSMESVRYANISNDYQDGLESSDRMLQAVQSARTVEYAIGLYPDEAKQLAVVSQQVAQAGLVRIGPVSLGPQHRDLEAGDVVTLGLPDGGQIQMLIAKISGDRGVVTVEGVSYDAAAYLSDATTANAYVPSMTVRRPPDTLVEFIDPPLLVDTDDTAHFWVAAKPSRQPWPGYSMQRSPDDVGYAELYRDSKTAVFGDCLSTLPAWAGGEVVDWASSVTVEVGAAQLSSITRGELLTSRANLAMVGGELLQFQRADLVATGVYLLSGFVRYRGGTEWVVHGADERFVLLDASRLARVPSSVADKGVSHYYRAVTLGRNLETATPLAFAPALVSLTPLAPANLRVVQLPGGDVHIHWDRRTRHQSNALRGSVPLGEASEAYEIEVQAPGGGIQTFSASSSSVVVPAGGYRPLGLSSATGGGRWGVELDGDVFAVRDNQLSRMDGGTLFTLGRTGFPPSVMGLTTDGVNLFACHLGNPAGGLLGQLVKLSPTLAPLGAVNFPLLADGAGVTFCAGSLWVSLPYSGLVRRYSTALATVADVTVSPEVCRLTTDGAHVYVVDKLSRTAYKIDPATNTVVLTIALSSQPVEYTDIAVAAGRLFVTEVAQVMVYSTTTGYQDLSGPPIFGKVLNAVGSDVAIQNGLDFAIYDASTLTRSGSFSVVPPPGALFPSGTLLSADRMLIDNTSVADYYDKAPLLPGSIVRVRQLSASVGRGHPAIKEI